MNHSERLKFIRDELGGLSQQAFADSIGEKQGKIRDIEIGKQKISIEMAQVIEKIHSYDFKWILTGEGKPHGAGAIDIVKIPERGEVESAAGEGCSIYDETITGEIAFDRTLLKKIGANIPYCDVIRIKGESMSPTLNTGDKVLVDKSQKTIIDGKIYIIKILEDNLLKVKRLYKIGKQRIKAVSDNHTYPTVEYDPEEYELCGRVLWSIFIV